MPEYLKNCESCMSNNGTNRISPSKPIYEGKYWLVEHAYPSGLLGWLVILPKRHVEAIHELTDLENREFGRIYPKVIEALHRITKSKKEYVFQIAKGSGFKHVHYHVISIDKKLPADIGVVKIFGLKNNKNPISEKKVIEFCDKVRRGMSKK